MPPLWFLSVYERLLRGDAAPPFAGELARYASAQPKSLPHRVLLTYPTGLGAYAQDGH